MGELKPERALILYDENGSPQLEVVAAHGVDPQTVWTGAPFSTTLLQNVRDSGTPLITSDATRDPDFADVFSLQMSDIRSVICVPFFGPDNRVVGLLYADSRATRGAFKRDDLGTVTTFARRLEELLYREKGAAAPQAWPRPAPARTPRRPSPPASPTPEPSDERLDLARRVLLFRSLATIVGAGLTLHGGLNLLGQPGEEPQLEAVARGLARRVERGQPLSRAMRDFPESFGSFECNLIQVAEKSGRLHLVLDRLATRLEESHRVTMKVRGALVYPSLLLMACLALMVLAPPYLLAGQLEMLKNSGAEPPALTRMLMTFSDLVRSPFFLLGLGGAAVGLGWLVRSLLRRPGPRLAASRRALRVPYLGPVLKLLASSRFARSLALQLESGVLLSEAMPLAAQASGQPVLEEEMKACVQALFDGAALGQALGRSTVFPRGFVPMVETGEASGRSAFTLAWLADFYDLELEAALGRFTAAFEPVMLVSMGMMVAVTLLGTLLPTLNLVEGM